MVNLVVGWFIWSPEGKSASADVTVVLLRVQRVVTVIVTVMHLPHNYWHNLVCSCAFRHVKPHSCD